MRNNVKCKSQLLLSASGTRRFSHVLREPRELITHHSQHQIAAISRNRVHLHLMFHI